MRKWGDVYMESAGIDSEGADVLNDVKDAWQRLKTSRISVGEKQIMV